MLDKERIPKSTTVTNALVDYRAVRDRPNLSAGSAAKIYSGMEGAYERGEIVTRHIIAVRIRADGDGHLIWHSYWYNESTSESVPRRY